MPRRSLAFVLVLAALTLAVLTWSVHVLREAERLEPVSRSSARPGPAAPSTPTPGSPALEASPPAQEAEPSPSPDGAAPASPPPTPGPGATRDSAPSPEGSPAASPARPSPLPRGTPSPAPGEAGPSPDRSPPSPPPSADTGGPPLVGPPDGARLIADEGRVTLAWSPGRSRHWHVEVRAQGSPWVAEEVTRPTITLAAPPGSLYSWRVIDEGGGDRVPWRRFQVSDVRVLDHSGRDGAPGRDALGWGEAGGRGEDGGDARDLEVWVDEVGGFMRIRTEDTLGAREEVLVAPGGSPVTIRAAGGRGGRGGRGADGMGAIVHGRGGPIIAAGNGGAGGGGGNGGKGATLRAHVPAGLEERVIFKVAGGSGGPGGPGGGGSVGAPGRKDTFVYGPPGSPGPDGREGISGPPGTVQRVP